MRPLTFLSLFLGCVLASSTALLANELFVSPDGNDTNPGTTAQPVASLQQALELMAGGEGGTIWLAEGEYRINKSIALSDKHGGAASAPTVIRARVPHTARITGAKTVTGWQPIGSRAAKSLISDAARKKVLVADLKALGFPPLSQLPEHFGAPGCEELIFDDLPMQSARWPNKGFTAFTEVIDAGASDPIHWVSREVYRPGSFRFPSDRPKQWDFSRGVYLHGFWCYEWADEALRAAHYNADSGELRFAAKHRYGIGNPWHKDSKREFYAIHVFEELDQPGEYYLDRKANRLYFWPPEKLSGKSTSVSLCKSPLLTAKNVSHLVIQDLVFESGCGWGLQFGGCDNVHISNCIIRNLGLGGITMSGGHDNKIVQCEVTRTGSRAIALSAGDRKSLTHGNCAIVGNHLHHVGRFDWGGGRGITLTGCGNRAANNLIHHCPTGAVSYGGNEHLLELNEIHNVCTLYGDVGVFYTGRDWASRGNVVRWNYIHDVAENHGFGSQAIYLDDCDSGDTVVGNIVFGGVGKGVVIGGGRDNTIDGNVFIQLEKGIHVDARGPKGITLDKPGSWNLKAKCEQVGYHSALWKERYPTLATVLDDQPLMPMGNVLRNNVFVGCKEPWALKKEVKAEWLRRENNHSFKADEFSWLPASGSPLDLSQLPQIWQKVPGFKPIPVERIGLPKKE